MDIINKYIEDDEMKKAVLKYLRYNNIIKWNVFEIFYPGHISKFESKMELGLSNNLFIKTLPFILYEKNSVFPFKDYLISSLYSGFNLIEYIELIQILFYRYQVELFDIFNYPGTQQSEGHKYRPGIGFITHWERNTIDILKRWIKYLELINEVDNRSYVVTPKNLIIAYNDLLVACGKNHEIFYLKQISDMMPELRKDEIVFQGCIPVDDDGIIRTQYAGIQVENVEKMWIDKDKLYIKVNPNTKIYLMTQDSTDPVNIYTGICAYDIVWNGSKLSEYRNMIGMTQRQLAKYLDVTEDTIGNWESGRSKPEITSYEKIKHIFRTFGIECDLFDH